MLEGLDNAPERDAVLVAAAAAPPTTDTFVSVDRIAETLGLTFDAVEFAGEPPSFEVVGFQIAPSRLDAALATATAALAADSQEAAPLIRLRLEELTLRQFAPLDEAAPSLSPPLDGGPSSSLEWEAILAPEGRLTDDGRAFAPGSIRWRDLPLTLMAMLETQEGHDGARVCGRIDSIWRDEATGLIRAAGVFDDSDFGHEIARMVDEKVLRGNSVDLAIHDVEIGPRSRWFDEDGNWSPQEAAAAETDEQELVELLFGDPSDEPTIYVVTDAVIGMSTVCPFPAFADARIEAARSLAAAGSPFVWTIHQEGGFRVTRQRPVTRAALLVASGTPVLTRAERDAAAGLGWTVVADDDGRLAFGPGPDAVAAAVAELSGGGGASGGVTTITAGGAGGGGHLTASGGAGGMGGAIGQACVGGFSGVFAGQGGTGGGSVSPNAASALVTGDGVGTGPAPGSLVAALLEAEVAAEVAPVAIPTQPPAEWFDDPQLAELTPLVVTPEGRIYGHAAGWSSCHTGFADVCVTPPHSATEYRFFHLKEIECDDGSRIACGTITLEAPHANQRLGLVEASAHYDHTGVAAADIVVGEDEHGIWIAGAARPHLTDEMLRELRGAALSGDWRDYQGNLELIGLLAVNVPGFPIPRVHARVASGVVQSLTAAGILTGREPDGPIVVTVDDETLAELRALTDDGVALQAAAVELAELARDEA